MKTYETKRNLLFFVRFYVEHFSCSSLETVHSLIVKQFLYYSFMFAKDTKLGLEHISVNEFSFCGNCNIEQVTAQKMKFSIEDFYQ